MEGLIEDLNELSKQPHLYPAEQIITTVLLDFEKAFNSSSKFSDIEPYEQAFLSLFSINSGNLSFQCSVRISNCLVRLYKTQSSPKIWNLMTMVTKSPNFSNITALGGVIRSIGHYSKSMLPGLVKKLLSIISKFAVPCLYTLNQCFKIDYSGLKSFASQTFSSSVGFTSSKDETEQLLAIKLLRSLIKTKTINTKLFYNAANAMFENHASTFVIDEASYFVARLAFLPFMENQSNAIDENNQSEWKLSKQGTSMESNKLFESSFQVLSKYPDHFASIFKHFLNLLSPEVIHKNLPILFEFVRNTMPQEVVQLVSLFGVDVRKELFSKVAKEEPPTSHQLLLLRALENDFVSSRELAAIALQLTQTSSQSSRLCGASYFGQLSNKYPQHAKLYLETASLYLASPPEDNPSNEQDIQGMASVATYILGVCKEKESMLDGLTDNIKVFLDRALQIEDIYDAQYSSAFSIMTVLPESMIPKELVPSALQRFLEQSEKMVGVTDPKSSKLKRVGQSIVLFLAQHPCFSDLAPVLSVFMSVTAFHNKTIMMGILLAAPLIIPHSETIFVMANQLLDTILTLKPSSEYSRALLKCPMSSCADLLAPIVFRAPNYEIIFDKIGKAPFCFYVLENFTKLIDALAPSHGQQIIQHIIESPKEILMAHCLLLTVSKDQKYRYLFPSDLHLRLIEYIDEKTTISKAQITSEIIALFVKDDTDALQEVFYALRNQRGRPKCFIYAALFAHAPMSVSYISLAMHELNDISKNTRATPIALHALSVLYYCRSIELSSMKVTDIQSQALLQLVNTHVILKPLSLYYFASCFMNLLPVLSPEINSERNSLIPLIRLLIQSFSQISIPFAHEICFKVLRAVFAFARDLINIESISFPVSRGDSISLQLAACGAFADMLKVDTQLDKDYFDLVPKLFVLLQRSGDSRASDFIIEIGRKFKEKSLLDPNSTNSRERLMKWFSYIKVILSANALPLTGDATIEADNNVKKSALSLSKYMLQVLSQSSPLLTECLDDLMTCITRSIESKEIALYPLAFSINNTVIELFEHVKSESGNRLLELYDSQFSIAVRYGFSCDLEHSGSFLIHFLAFHYDNLTRRPDEFMTVLNGFIGGLKECKQKTFAYFSIASHICSIARQNFSVFSLIESFVSDFVSQFSEIVCLSMRLWSEDPPNWSAIASFRTHYEKFYRELLTSFIWLQHHFKMKLIPIKDLIFFFNKEVTHCTESWRVLAAFEALASTFLYYAKEIEMSDVKASISSVHKANQLSPQLLSTALPSFVLSCSKLIKDGSDEMWIHLSEFAIHNTFSLEALAYIVQSGTVENVISISEEVTKVVIKKFIQGSVSEKQFIAFFTHLFGRIPEKVPLVIELITENPVFIKERPQMLLEIFKHSIIQATNENTELIRLYSSIAWSHFCKGGMVFIASILKLSPKVGSMVFELDEMNTLTELCTKDLANVIIFLQFIRYSLSIISAFDINPSILIKSGNIAIEAISLFGQDPQKGRDLIVNGVNLLTDIKTINEKSLKESFRQASQRSKQLSIQLIEKQISKLNTRKKVRTLKTFSNSSRKTHDDDEWQSLD